MANGHPGDTTPPRTRPAAGLGILGALLLFAGDMLLLGHWGLPLISAPGCWS